MNQLFNGLRHRWELPGPDGPYRIQTRDYDILIKKYGVAAVDRELEDEDCELYKDDYGPILIGRERVEQLEKMRLAALSGKQRRDARRGTRSQSS